MKRAAPEGNGSRHPQPIVARPDDDARITEMRETAAFADMTHISELVETELRRLATSLES